MTARVDSATPLYLADEHCEQLNLLLDELMMRIPQVTRKRLNRFMVVDEATMSQEAAHRDDPRDRMGQKAET